MRVADKWEWQNHKLNRYSLPSQAPTMRNMAKYIYHLNQLICKNILSLTLHLFYIFSKGFTSWTEIKTDMTTHMFRSNYPILHLQSILYTTGSYLRHIIIVTTCTFEQTGNFEWIVYLCFKNIRNNSALQLMHVYKKMYAILKKDWKRTFYYDLQKT